VVSAFEDWPLPEETFDTRAVRDGLHWLDPDTRMTKAADALRPDGSLAVISTPHIAGVTEDFFVNVQRRYERFDRHVPPGLRLPTSAEISTGADEFDQSLRFGPAEFLPYEWEQNALNTLIAWSLSSALQSLRERGFAAGCAARRKGGKNIRTDRPISEIRRGTIATEHSACDGLRPEGVLLGHLWLYPAVVGRVAEPGG
jgi:SAM-dependent methyltransferase